MDRKLVSVQKVIDIEPIDGADFIEKARVEGWDVIVKKGDFEIGNLGVFFEVDSVIPDTEWSKFLDNHMRIRTKKLRGVLSQGLFLGLDILPKWIEAGQEPEFMVNRVKVTDKKNHPGMVKISYQEDDDVTSLLGVEKWEPEVRDEGSGKNFPSDIPKTNETRIQSAVKVLEELYDKPYIATVKLDGRSMSAWYDPDDGLHMASHNFEKKSDGGGIEWNYAENNNLATVLVKFPNFVFQGELCGPAIQKNRLNLTTQKWYVFNIYDRNEHKYLGFMEMADILAELKLLTAPVEEIGLHFEYTLEELLAKADGVYEDSGGNVREGLVFRSLQETHSKVLQGRTSFKVISNKFLLKTEKDIDKAEKSAEVATPIVVSVPSGYVPPDVIDPINKVS